MMKNNQPKTLDKLLQKIELKFGFTLTPALYDYVNHVPHLTAEKFAITVLADEEMDVILNWDLKKQLEQTFENYFSQTAINN